MLQSKAECDRAAGIYHYKLWLPRGYLAQPHRYWPCVFIASPFGNARMGNMAESLKRTHVVVMLIESRNGPWPPTIGNFLAAHDDVVRRIRIREGQKIATGLSGGARASSVFVQIRPGFAGVILQGAGVARTRPTVRTTSTTSRTIHRCYSPCSSAKTIHGEPRLPICNIKSLPDHLAVLLFHGGHQWAPADVFAKALSWIESRAPQ